MSDVEFGDLLDSTGPSGSLKDNKEVFLDELGVFGVEEITPGCLSKMSEFCAVYESSPETIASAWIAFSIKKGIHAGNITVALLEQMEQEVLSKDSSKSTVKTPVSRKTAPRIFTANSKRIFRKSLAATVAALSVSPQLTVMNTDNMTISSSVGMGDACEYFAGRSWYGWFLCKPQYSSDMTGSAQVDSS